MLPQTPREDAFAALADVSIFALAATGFAEADRLGDWRMNTAITTSNVSVSH